MTQEIKVVKTERRQASRWDKYARRWNGEERRYVTRKSRLYVWPSDWDVMEDFAGGRFANPVKAFRLALPEIYRQLGIPEGTKAVWNQYAGCSCPCSPGFVLDYPEDGDPVDFAAVVEPFEPEINDKVIERRQALGLEV